MTTPTKFVVEAPTDARPAPAYPLEEKIELLLLVFEVLQHENLLLKLRHYNWAFRYAFYEQKAEDKLEVAEREELEELMRVVQQTASRATEDTWRLLAGPREDVADDDVGLRLSLLLGLLLAPWNLAGFPHESVRWDCPFKRIKAKGGMPLIPRFDDAVALMDCSAATWQWRVRALETFTLASVPSQIPEVQFVLEKLNPDLAQTEAEEPEQPKQPPPATGDPLDVILTGDPAAIVAKLKERDDLLGELRKLFPPTLIDGATASPDDVEAALRGNAALDAIKEKLKPTVVTPATVINGATATVDEVVRAIATNPARNAIVTALTPAPAPVPATVVDLSTATPEQVLAGIAGNPRRLDIIARLAPRLPATVVNGATCTVDELLRAIAGNPNRDAIVTALVPPLPPTAIDTAISTPDEIIRALPRRLRAAVVMGLIEVTDAATLTAALTERGDALEVVSGVELAVRTRAAALSPAVPLAVDVPPPEREPRRKSAVPLVLMVLTLLVGVGVLVVPGLWSKFRGAPATNEQKDENKNNKKGDKKDAAVVTSGVSKDGEGTPVVGDDKGEAKKEPTATARWTPRYTGDVAERMKLDLDAELPAAEKQVGKLRGLPWLTALAYGGDNYGTTWRFKHQEVYDAKKDFLGFITAAAAAGKLDDPKWTAEPEFYSGWLLVRRSLIYGTGYPYSEHKDYSQTEVTAERERILKEKIGVTFNSGRPVFSSAKMTAERWAGIEREFVKGATEVEDEARRTK